MAIIDTFDMELHHSADESEQAEARARAADMDNLGVDHAPDDGAPFPEVLAHLVMFDPAWLFAQGWMAGWVVTPNTEED